MYINYLLWNMKLNILLFFSGDFTAEWQLWIPFLFFSGGVTMVIFGRLLASVPFGALHLKKLHQE